MTAPPIARTSGGKWNPTDPNLAFLAGNIQDHTLAANPCTLIAVNELRPGHFDLLDRWCDERRVLLDSGVFALAADYARTHDVPMSVAFATDPADMEGWNQLYDRWCTIASRFADRLWGVIELDQGGAEAATATRARVLADTGLTPIPVYHPLGDGWDYYDDLAAAHDRICVGGLAGRIPSAVRLRLCWTAAQRAHAYPHLWTHLLGVTPSPMLLSLGLRGSVDSSAWLSPVRWAVSWKSRAMLAPLGDMPLGMTYRRDMGDDPAAGHSKAKRQAGAAATFGQTVLAAVAEDTHPTLTRKEPTP